MVGIYSQTFKARMIVANAAFCMTSPSLFVQSWIGDVTQFHGPPKSSKSPTTKLPVEHLFL
ncbi:hypothetical protein HUJ05_012790 [Dendroctonus ponderosae]|nr:hypothetical protein HUJ05_012790 [Dendroctonus ponderosae]